MVRSKKRKPSTTNKRTQGQKRQAKHDPVAFWGDPDKFTDPATDVLITSNPSAVIKSLGKAPLSGQQNASEYYFKALYERAVVLASALAAAGDLVEAEDLQEDLQLD